MKVLAAHTLSEIVESKVAPQTNVAVKPSIAAWCGNSWRKIASEFFATTLLVLLGCMGCVGVPGFESPLYGALSFGMVVMFNIQIFSHISGAHMNPAVTLASVLWGSTSISLGIAYVIAQCVGALVGFGVLDALTGMDLAANSICVTRPLAGQTPLQSLGIETALTTALILINLGMWDPLNRAKQDSVEIKFGLSIVGLSMVGGPFTGASMNPARSLGPAVWNNFWADHWIYWVGPFLGVAVGFIPYKYILQVKSKD